MAEGKGITRNTAEGGTALSPVPMIDLSRPRYDQTTFAGRAQHFFETANPVNVFVSSKRLEDSARLVTLYRWARIISCTHVLF